MHGVIKVNSAGLRHADGRWSQVMCSKREALRPSEVGKENKSSKYQCCYFAFKETGSKVFLLSFFCLGFHYVVN